MSPYGTMLTTVHHGSEANQRVFLEDFENGSQLARGPGDGIRVVFYDVARYPFAEHIAGLLVDKGLLRPADRERIDSLDHLHKFLPPEFKVLDGSEINEVSKHFYEQNAAFTATYERFLKEVVRGRVIDGDFVFQQNPTIRFHFPHQQGFNWKPRYHTDIMLGHPPQEINLWFPLTRTFDSNSMRLTGMAASIALLRSTDLDFAAFNQRVQEDEELQRRCEAASAPVRLDYGQMVAFDARCIHATQYNTTDSTRISIDFRVMPLADYQALRIPYRGTGRRQMLFQQGHYYDQRTSATL